MALPLLVNGADCGPVNPLQSLGKRFDQDRGLQQVRLLDAPGWRGAHTYLRHRIYSDLAARARLGKYVHDVLPNARS
jgi:hypothetical protein